MVVQHNIPAINSHRNLLVNNSATAKNLEKLSSGYRINRAGDDAAGLAISEKMRGQIRGLAKAEENAQNGISLIQTAEGGMQEIHSILQRMRELAVQSANGTYKDEVDRENLNLEFQSLKSEIDRISDYTNYNGIKLLNGELGVDLEIGRAIGDITVGGTPLAAGNLQPTPSGAAWADGDSYDLSFTFDEDGKIAGVTGSVVLNGITYKVDSSMMAAAGTDLEINLTSAIKITFDDFDLDEEFTYDHAGTDINLRTLNISNSYAGAVPTWDTGTVKATYISEERELIFQIGANGTADQQVSLYVQNMHSSVLGAYRLDNITQTPFYDADAQSVADQNIATRDHANAAIDVLDNAINMVSTQRAGLGALQNRLEYTLNNLGVTKENLTSAESVIRDVDMAKEMMEFTKNQILVQASQAMLATANQLPQGILNLLR